MLRFIILQYKEKQLVKENTYFIATDILQTPQSQNGTVFATIFC